MTSPLRTRGIPFLAMSLLSCHSAGFTHAAIPGQPSPVADATITEVVDVHTARHQSYALLPVTINGHPATVILDLGSNANVLARRMMAQFGGDSVTIGTTVQRNVSFIPLESVGGELVAGAMRGRLHAQTVDEARLTVHRSMATGTTNPAAGEYPLDSTPNAIVSIPPQCAGAKRCPLLVQLPGGGQPASVMTGWMHPVAKKYGFILLALSEKSYEPAYVNTVLTDVFTRFAIDTSKIAVAGRCASGGAGMTYGIHNLHLFNRIISVSGGVPVDGMNPQNTTAEFLIDRGVHEVPDNFTAAQALRAGGHPVTVALGLREHEHQWEDYDFVGHWLMESWTPHASPKPSGKGVGPLPALTTAVMTKMTAFWTRFAKEPDSIRLTARRRYLQETIIPVGQERPVVWMTDMPAFAEQYPTVAADFKRAGLTAKEHDDYKIALMSAMVAAEAAGTIGEIDTASTLAKNIAFLVAHPEEGNTLAQAGIEDPAKAGQIGGCCTDPDQVDRMGPLGIWRTP